MTLLEVPSKKAREDECLELVPSKLYAHFRAVGRVTDGVPGCLYYMNGAAFLTTSVESLNLVFSSSELPSSIISLCNKDEHTVVATSDGIFHFVRARLHATLKLSLPQTTKVHLMGDLLMVLTSDALSVYSFPSLKVLSKLSWLGKSEATCVVHPVTYLNKVVVGFADGHLELWNTKSEKLIFSFPPLSSTSITAITAAPVLDVISVGFADGKVVLFDVRQNEPLFSLSHPTKVRDMAFRNDSSQESQLAVGLDDGQVYLWNLDKRQMHSIWRAHKSFISTVFFVENHPIIVTTGGDNSVQEWIVEGADVRPLRSRCGHSKPPQMIRFYAEGDCILSAGQDRQFRNISMIKDSQSNELSQGSIESISRRTQISSEELRLDPIIDFACFTVRNLKWDNVVTAHEKSAVARTWRADHRCIGSHELRTMDNSFATSVAISACGNFAYIGTITGCVDQFNIQSGQHRKHFKGHLSKVIGICVDSANRYLISVHEDGSIRCLDILGGTDLFVHNVEEEILRCAFHPDAELLILALQSGQIHVFDVVGKAIVRRFVGHQKRIIDLVISDDGKWVISASLDSTIRSWDLISGLQLDILHLPSPPSSIDISPKLDFLAVVLEGDVAIHLWTNLSMYSPVALQEVNGSINFLIDDSVGDMTKELVELSMGPTSKSHNLYHFESTKARNKPVLPSKIPEKAPFFLDALLSKGTKEEDPNENSLGSRKEEQTDFQTFLVNEKSADKIFEFLKKLGPSEFHMELSSVIADYHDDLRPLIHLLSAIMSKIESGQDFDLAVTFLNLTLFTHKDVMTQQIEEFREILNRGRLSLRHTWGNLENQYQDALCLSTFARDE